MATAAVPTVFKLTNLNAVAQKQYTDTLCDSRYCSTPAVDLDSFVASPQIQSAFQECCKLGIRLEDVHWQFTAIADSECKRLERLPLPISDILKTSVTKFSDGILPNAQGGYADYGGLAGYEESDGDGGNRTVSVPSLAAQRAKLVSNHIRFNDADSNKHGSFADTDMTGKDQTGPDLGSQPRSTGNLLLDFIIGSKVDTMTAVRIDQLVAKLPHTKLSAAEWETLSDFIGKNAASVKHALELANYARKQEVSSVTVPMLDMVSHMRSTAKAAQPPPFHGTLKDHGQPARLWVLALLATCKHAMRASRCFL